MPAACSRRAIVSTSPSTASIAPRSSASGARFGTMTKPSSKNCACCPGVSGPGVYGVRHAATRSGAQLRTIADSHEPVPGNWRKKTPSEARGNPRERERSAKYHARAIAMAATVAARSLITILAHAGAVHSSAFTAVARARSKRGKTGTTAVKVACRTAAACALARSIIMSTLYRFTPDGAPPRPGAAETWQFTSRPGGGVDVVHFRRTRQVQRSLPAQVQTHRMPPDASLGALCELVRAAESELGVPSALASAGPRTVAGGEEVAEPVGNTQALGTSHDARRRAPTGREATARRRRAVFGGAAAQAEQ